MRVIACAALLVAAATLSPAAAYVLNNQRWVEKPAWIYDVEGESDCCLTPPDEPLDVFAFEREIVRGRKQWKVLKRLPSTSSNGLTLKVQWRPLSKLVASVTSAEEVPLGVTRPTFFPRCQNCGGGTVAILANVVITLNNHPSVRWYGDNALAECLAAPGWDLKSVAAHEFGHAVGLTHSDKADSTMAPVLDRCDDRFFPIRRDDRLGYKANYKAKCGKVEDSCLWVERLFTHKTICRSDCWACGDPYTGGPYRLRILPSWLNDDGLYEYPYLKKQIQTVRQTGACTYTTSNEFEDGTITVMPYSIVCEHWKNVRTAEYGFCSREGCLRGADGKAVWTVRAKVVNSYAECFGR